ncbi:MAG: selenide, water dikinase SelD [Nitrospirae bacterium]|nr:selenide, water dikinase SelD [Nitrospirota bacterium]
MDSFATGRVSAPSARGSEFSSARCGESPRPKVDVLVGPGDDGGVYTLRGMTMIETVDFITPVVNDPFNYGAISAANSISDIYAMGGMPITALAIAALPTCDYDTTLFKEILRGAVQTIKKAGAVLIGGHSMDARELMFGLSVTGIVDANTILRAQGAKEGDVLVLTKPLGIGILTTALKTRSLSEEDLSEAIGWMTTLNERASKLAISAGASACTDVTGFGLLGHAYNMVRDSDVDFIIASGSVPILDRTREMAAAGKSPGGAFKNLTYLEGNVSFSQSVNRETRLILADPQTSGGLLIAMNESRLGILDGTDMFYRAIGEVTKGTGKIHVA